MAFTRDNCCQTGIFVEVKEKVHNIRDRLEKLKAVKMNRSPKKLLQLLLVLAAVLCLKSDSMAPVPLPKKVHLGQKTGSVKSTIENAL